MFNTGAPHQKVHNGHKRAYEVKRAKAARKFVTVVKTIKSSTFSIGFRGISQLGSAFIFLR